MQDQTGASFEDKEDALKDGGGTSEANNKVRMWLAVLDAATKEEKDWREEADQSLKIYRADDSKDSQTYFNILHSNVETILPAVYNSTPVPDIRRRFNDKGVATKEVADLLERSISYSLDSYDFDGTMRSVLFDAYVAGRGVVRVRYVPYFTPAPGEDENEESAERKVGSEIADSGEEPQEVVSHEEVICEYVPWPQFRRGPGRVWADVPWVGFEHFLSREQLTALNEKLGPKVPLDATIADHGDAKGADGYQTQEQPPKSEIFGRARVWEIWDKDSKTVLFIAPGYPVPLVDREDPLRLTDFFPIPRPVQPLMTPGNMVPMCPYRAYKRLAEELNDITRRIQRLIKQLRVRGIYASSTQSLEGVLNADDGELVPAPGLEQFVDGGGLEKAIAWWPIEPTVKALAQLYQQREQVKQAIYEVTGISDIVRGSTEASETATAQSLKSQWGSLRIQRMQADVARFARDLFRIKAEIIASKFSMQNLMLMTGIELPTEQQKMLLQQQTQAGQPAPPQAAEVLQKPTVEEVEKILRSDLLRSYRVDIESDSTIRADLTRDKQEISEFIQGTAAYVGAIGPAVQEGTIPKALALEMFSGFARLFRLGKSAEDALDQAGQAAQDEAKNPQPEKPNPEMMKVQAEAQANQQKMQADMQMQQQKLQMDAQKMQMEHDLKQRQMQQEFQLKREEMAFQRQLKQEELQAGLAMRAQESQAKIEQIRAGVGASLDIHGVEMERMAADGAMAQEKHQAGIQAMKAKAKHNNGISK